MHLKLTKHGRFCKQNNQLPTKTHDKLKDNSNKRGKTDRYLTNKLVEFKKWPVENQDYGKRNLRIILEELFLQNYILLQIIKGKTPKDANM